LFLGLSILPDESISSEKHPCKADTQPERWAKYSRPGYDATSATSATNSTNTGIAKT